MPGVLYALYYYPHEFSYRTFMNKNERTKMWGNAQKLSRINYFSEL